MDLQACGNSGLNPFSVIGFSLQVNFDYALSVTFLKEIIGL